MALPDTRVAYLSAMHYAFFAHEYVPETGVALMSTSC